MIRIGIPRALFFYDYFPFCKFFFEGLGAEVIVSDMTNRTILKQGLKDSSNELCIPMKLLYGHVGNLKDRCDYIFLPYIITVDENSFICPKLIASPDIIRNTLDVKILTADIDNDNLGSTLYDSLKQVMTKINANPVTILSVYKEAMEKQKAFEKYKEDHAFDEALDMVLGKDIENKQDFEMTLAVVGHSYIINDTYITSDLMKKLKDKKVKVLTSDMPPKNIIDDELKILEKLPHWTIPNRVLGSAIHFSKKKEIDGIIYVTPFGCSPDSLMKENMVNYLHDKKLFMTITVDEHTGEAGLVTRIEAFIDMIKRKDGRD